MSNTSVVQPPSEVAVAGTPAEQKARVEGFIFELGTPEKLWCIPSASRQSKDEVNPWTKDRAISSAEKQAVTKLNLRKPT